MQPLLGFLYFYKAQKQPTVIYSYHRFSIGELIPVNSNTLFTPIPHKK